MKTIDFLTIIQKELNEVEKKLLSEVSSVHSLSSEVSKYVFRSGGKRLRPALLLLCAKHYNYNGGATIQIAAAIELIHTASLLHDDVVDEATLRRGTASVNSVWGNRISILVGDFLFAKASRILSRYTKYEVTKMVSNTMLKMVEGELLQMSKNKNYGTTEKDYIEIINKKTADLLSIACRIGASLGGGKSLEINSFSNFGKYFGIAFQIIDDTLDYTSTEVEFGKAIGNDLKEGKLTLPLIHVLKTCSEKEQKRVFETIKSSSPDIHYIHKLINKYNSIDYAKKKAMEFSISAVDELKKLKSSRARTALEKLSEYIIERRF